MKILITGANGLLGTEIQKALTKYDYEIYPHLDTFQMDITTPYLVDKKIAEIRPDVVIHLAALTQIGRCENDKNLAWNVNARGTLNIVRAMSRLNDYNGKLVYMSTPCIFEGEGGPYNEDSIPNPTSFYGLTKLVGEQIAKTYKNHLVVRSNFIKRDVYQFEKAFTDRVSNYLFADTLADEICKLIEDNAKGTWHIWGDKELSMFDIAKITRPDIKELTLDEYYKENPNAVKLTRDMRLISKFNPAVEFK